MLTFITIFIVLYYVFLFIELFINNYTHMTFNSNTANYYHLLIEIVSRLVILEQQGLLKNISLLIPNNVTPICYKILKHFNYKELIIMKQNTTYVCDIIYYVDYVLDKDYYNDSWSCYLSSKYSTEALYKKFVSNTNTSCKHIIYISRNNYGFVRTINNEDILINDVLIPLFGKELVIFNKEYLSKCDDCFNKQIELFKNAHMVISPHGAGLSNIAFCNKDTKVIEFVMNPNCNLCFQYLSDIRNLQYYPVDLFTSYYHGKYDFKKEYVEPLTNILKQIYNGTYKPMDFSLLK